MSDREQEGLRRLHQELADSELPPPELLARYATDPNSLAPAEKQRVEDAMASSPAVVDELDTLRHFDVSRLNADRASVADRGFGSWLGELFRRPALWVPVTAALVLAIWMARPDGGGEVGEAAPQVAQHESPTPARDTGPGVPPEALVDPIDATDPPRPEEIAAVPEAAPAPDPRGVSPGAPELDDPPPSAEILVAMAMPSYRPAFGIDPVGGEWIVRSPTEDVRIAIVAPDHVTRTRRRSPVLHWSLDRLPEAGDFYLSILDANDEAVVLDRRLPAPKVEGIQRLALEDFDIELPLDRRLRWSVALRDSEETPPRSFDFGWLRVEALGADAEARIGGLAIAEQVAPLAELGCFHDALDAALLTRERHPEDPRPGRAIELLLEEAGS